MSRITAVNKLDLKNWTQNQLDKYLEQWKVCTNKQLSAIYGISERNVNYLNTRFNLKKSKEYKSEIYRLTYVNTVATRKKRKDAKSVGEIVTRKNANGKNLAYILTDNGWQRLHVYNWQQAGNEIPTGYVLYFKDRNPENCEVDNLELRTRADVANENRDGFYSKNPTKKFLKSLTPPQRRQYYTQTKEQKKIEREQRKEQKKLDRIKEQEAKRKERIEKSKRSNVEREWQAASKRNRTVKRLADRPLDLSSKIAVKLDHRTTVYVKPGTDIEMIRKQYLKAS